MAHHEPQSLPIAVRVFPDWAGAKAGRSRRLGPRPEGMLVIDTETRIDATQKLTFGSSRLIVGGNCLEEVLFYADDLPEEDRRTLQHYVETHRADTANHGIKQLRLMSRGEFVKEFYNIAYKARCLVVGFNLPY